MKKLKFLLPVFIALSVGYYFIFPDKVQVAEVTRGPAVQAIYATGTVETTEMLPLAPRVAGRITELLVDEGSKVSKGQVLVRLAADESKAIEEQLASRADIARREYSRQERLLKSGATTQELFDRTKSELEFAVAALKAERTRQDYLSLKAPKDGLILKRDGEPGQFVNANQTIFWFSSNAPLRITAEVDEEDISQVIAGQKVLIRSDAFKDKVFDGEVSSITPKGDPVARSYRVRISLKEETPLMIGMTAENNIIIREKASALLVPTTSLRDNSVWLVKNSRLEKRQVVIAAKGGDFTEVMSGVEEGDLVVSNPDTDLQDGQHVRVKLTTPKN